MTKKEVNDFLANTKVYVNGKSKEIQEKLFSLGYSWNEESTGTDVCHTEAPFLFIYEDTSITMSSDMDLFCNHDNSEITADEILSLELTEPSYRPFNDNEEDPKSPWISVNEDLPYNHKELLHSNYTDSVLVSARNGYSEVAFMSKIEDDWEWSTFINVKYWMPIPSLPKEY